MNFFSNDYYKGHIVAVFVVVSNDKKLSIKLIVVEIEIND